MSSLIEFPLTSPCPAHRDAILSWVVEGSESPAAKVAAEHVRMCAGCRGFRDSLKMQRGLLRDLSRTPPVVEDKELKRELHLVTTWIDEQLKLRCEGAIAREMWRCADSLLRFDAGISRNVFSEVLFQNQEDLNEVASAASLASRLDDYSSIFGKLKSLAKLQHERLDTAVELLKDGLGARHHKARIGLIRFLAEMAPQVSWSVASQMRSILANVEWYCGDELLVSAHLHQALSLAQTPSQRANAIANLAVFKSSHGDISSALEIGIEAIRVCDWLIFPRINLAVWSIVGGRLKAAQQLLMESAQLASRARLRQDWPWTLLDEWLRCGMSRIGASESETDRASRLLHLMYRDAVEMPAAAREWRKDSIHREVTS